MATKSKAAKETAPKAAKEKLPVVAASKAVAAKGKKVSIEAASMAAPADTAKTKKPVKAALQKTSPIAERVAVKASPVKKALPKVAPIAAQATPAVSQEPLQDEKWQAIKLILEKLKEEALREIRKSVKNGTEALASIEPGGDIYDQASSERDRELGLLLGDREREKIHSIDEALLRIDEGEYGICEECDEDIPLGRLKAMPFTRHCVKCKSDLEKLQAQTKRVEEERAYREIPLGSEEEES